VQVGAQKSQGAYALGLDLAYSTRSRLSLDFTLRLGLGREPRSGRFYSQAQGMASHGAMSAQAFLDANGNGRRDAGEKPLPGVGFMVNGAAHPRTTDREGLAFLTNLSGDVDANLSVSTSTLEDPLMRPGAPGLRITPRPGHVVPVDVALVLFGEITGTVYLKQEGGSRELPGLLLDLVDGNGVVLKRVRTAFDGFYTLSDLPPGSYRLQAAPADLERLGLSPTDPKAVTITPDGTVIDGLDLVYSQAPAPQEALRKEEAP
jgi:hypothetical protein